MGDAGVDGDDDALGVWGIFAGPEVVNATAPPLPLRNS